MAIHSVSGVRVSIKAARHLEGLDVLRRAHATGALSDDACQTHLLLHVDLLLTSQTSVNLTALAAQPHDFILSFVYLSHLDPGVPVVGGGRPGIDDALVVESSQLGAPTLKPQDAVVHRGSRDLGLHDRSSLHPQQGNATWDTTIKI